MLFCKIKIIQSRRPVHGTFHCFVVYFLCRFSNSIQCTIGVVDKIERKIGFKHTQTNTHTVKCGKTSHCIYFHTFWLLFFNDILNCGAIVRMDRYNKIHSEIVYCFVLVLWVVVVTFCFYFSIIHVIFVCDWR